MQPAFSCPISPPSRSLSRSIRPTPVPAGGSLPAQALDQRLGSLREQGATDRVRHSLARLMRPRVFAIALGYPACNDADRARADPLLGLPPGRAPSERCGLACQPTLLRFEN